MAMSSDSKTVYVGAGSATNSTVSSWDLSGTLNWGYELPSVWLPDMALSPDGTYLAFVSSVGHVYKMNLSSLTLT